MTSGISCFHDSKTKNYSFYSIRWSVCFWAIFLLVFFSLYLFLYLCFSLFCTRFKLLTTEHYLLHFNHAMISLHCAFLRNCWISSLVLLRCIYLYGVNERFTTAFSRSVFVRAMLKNVADHFSDRLRVRPNAISHEFVHIIMS